MSKTGVVKYYDAKHRRGSIVQDDGKPELFAQEKHCVDGMALRAGDAVRYDEWLGYGWSLREALNISGGSALPWLKPPPLPRGVRRFWLDPEPFDPSSSDEDCRPEGSSDEGSRHEGSSHEGSSHEGSRHEGKQR